jgi:tRNA (cytidine/uridine-2'-O-)-methyltransferase
MVRHTSWQSYLDTGLAGRLVLVSSKASQNYTDFAFSPDDTILLGRESAGVPPFVHDRADARLRIPMKSGLRSLNVAQAGAMIMGEALRQTGTFPP